MSLKTYAAFLICLFFCLVGQAQKRSDVDIELTIDSLLRNMSVEEKIGQLALRGSSSRVKGKLPNSLKNAVRDGKIGAILNVMNKEHVDILQRIAVEESEHGIPLIFARDVIHGFKTIFPIPLGIAATWDPSVAELAARISAEEASIGGIRWTFAPMLDIARDSRWGRVAESPGEDPYLASQLSKAYVAGFQGNDLSNPTSMIACAKHMIAYGAAIGGRDYNTAILSDPLLRNIYLPPFEAALKAGALTVMSSFNELNGIPATGNRYLLKDILREELKFDGFVVSDWNSVTEMIPHGFAADEKQAAEIAFKAGLDMEMTSTAYDLHLKQLLEEGKITEKEIDFYVANILRTKLRMGLFETPYIPEDHPGVLYRPESLAAAKQAAIDASVLLKNEQQILPLKKGTKIALIGPLADKGREQLGTWTFDSEGSASITPKMAFDSLDNHVIFEEGLSYSRDQSTEQFDAAIRAAENSDCILFVAGEEAILSGEAHSRASINLPGAQEALIKRLAKTGKPIVLVIMAGRPITIHHMIDELDAVLMMWHPGTMGGPALYDMIFGLDQPRGRLPITWPKTSGQLPLFYNHKNTGRPASAESFVQMDDIPIGAWQSSLGNNSHYLDAGYEPHFPFGYGMGYSKIKYAQLKLNSNTMTRAAPIIIEATIHNLGDRDTYETVQLYVRDKVGSITRPVRELKGFQKIYLKAGASKTVQFTIHASDLRFVNATGQSVIESGDFDVWIAPNASEGLKASFLLK